jgi:hypothetical protein
MSRVGKPISWAPEKIAGIQTPDNGDLGRSFNATTLIPTPVNSRPVYAGQLLHSRPSRGPRLLSTLPILR